MAIEFDRELILSGYNTNKINSNFSKIEEALIDGLSRSGSTPNQMNSDIDMNSNSILNAKYVSAENIVVDGVPQTGDAGVWYVGSGIPSASLGVLKDMYLDNTTGDVYGPKNELGWGSPTANIRGPQGTAGAGTGDMLKANNLTDLVSIPSARQNLLIPTYCPLRTNLKALDSSKDKVATLLEAGREGLFKWVDGDFSARIAADVTEGMFIKADAVASSLGAWVRMYEGDIKATWFGVIADNATDNLAAINAAIATIKLIGLRVLYFPVGVIRHSGPINVSSSFMVIKGAGKGATTFRRTYAASHTFYIANTSPNPIQNISIGDFSCDTTIRATSGSVFYVETGNGVSIQNVQISGGFHMITFAGCFECRATNIYAVYGETTFTTESGVIITTSAFTGAYGGNIYLHNVSVSNAFGNGGGGSGAAYGIQVIAVDGLFCTNCYFGYFGTAACYLFNTLAGVFLAGVKFNNCWFDHYQGNGVTIDGGVSSNFSDIEWIGCSMVGGTNAAYNFRHVDGNASRVRIIGCNLQGVNGDCIRINANGSSDDYLIEGNTITAFDMDNSAGGNGIMVTGGRSIVIRGNTINGNGTGDNGIQLTAGTIFHISGNHIRNVINGIAIAAGCNIYVVTVDNIVTGISGSKIIDLGGPTKSVSGLI